MMIASLVISSTLLCLQGASFYCLWWLNQERNRLHKRLNVQRKMIKSEKELRALGIQSLHEALSLKIDSLVSMKTASGKATPESKPVPPRTLTQAKREAEQRLASLTGVPQ